jgi:hypothetical protein
MKFDLHGHNRTTIEAGIVGTAINGTIRLESDFNVRYLFNSYIHHFDIFGRWLAIHAQRALGNPSHVSFMYSSIDDHLNGWISSQPSTFYQFILFCLRNDGSRWSSRQQES